MSDHSMTTPGEGRFGKGATTRPHDVNKRWYWLLLVPLLGVLVYMIARPAEDASVMARTTS